MNDLQGLLSQMSPGRPAGGLLGRYGGPQFMDPTAPYRQNMGMPAPFYAPFTPHGNDPLQQRAAQPTPQAPAGPTPQGLLNLTLPPFWDQHKAYENVIPGLMEAFGQGEPWAINLVRNPGILGSMGGE